MKLTAEDYMRHYRDLSDGELLSIDPGELVDVARGCYDAELSRRRLATDEPPPTDSLEPEFAASVPEIDPNEELVRVGVLTDMQGAMYVQKILRDAAIPSVLTNDPPIERSYAIGTIAVSVPESCADPARDLINPLLGRDNQVLVSRWLWNDWRPQGIDLGEFTLAIDDIFGDAGKVAARFTVSGVNPHTGRDVKFGGMAIVHVADGAIAEHWVKLDA